MKNLIDELYLCSAQCDTCHKECLEENEKEKDKLQRCMILTNECREICRLTGSLLESGTESAKKYLELTAHICSSCAGECQKHHHDHCQRCAAECRKCAEMCLGYHPITTALT